jgi:hypothetical protein
VLNIALSDELIEEFFKFKFSNSYDKDIAFHLFKYIQPFLIGEYQLDFLDEATKDWILKMSRSEKLFIPKSTNDQNSLIDLTKLKLMLTTDRNFYPYIDILDDEVDINYTATYKADDSRTKAKEHIKAILSQCNKIEIYDKFLLYDNNFQVNSNILRDIFLNTQQIKLFSENRNIRNKITDIQSIKSSLKNFLDVSFHNHNIKFHDRYIRTKRFEIILSSGLYYLGDTTKDFTYIVKPLSPKGEKREESY